MAGFLLGAKLASLSVIVYLCIRTGGVLCFAANWRPFHTFKDRALRFLLGFVLAAFLIGAITEKLKRPKCVLPHSSGNSRTNWHIIQLERYTLLHEEFLCGNTCQLQGIVASRCNKWLLHRTLHIMRIGNGIFC